MSKLSEHERTFYRFVKRAHGVQCDGCRRRLYVPATDTSSGGSTASRFEANDNFRRVDTGNKEVQLLCGECRRQQTPRRTGYLLQAVDVEEGRIMTCIHCNTTDLCIIRRDLQKGGAVGQIVLHFLQAGWKLAGEQGEVLGPLCDTCQEEHLAQARAKQGQPTATSSPSSPPVAATTT